MCARWMARRSTGGRGDLGTGGSVRAVVCDTAVGRGGISESQDNASMSGGICDVGSTSESAERSEAWSAGTGVCSLADSVERVKPCQSSKRIDRVCSRKPISLKEFIKAEKPGYLHKQRGI